MVAVILLLMIVVATVAVSVNLIVLTNLTHAPTGQAVDLAFVNFTQAGAAAVLMLDDSIGMGGGFFNSTCDQEFSILNSENPYNSGDSAAAAPRCWINTTALPRQTGVTSDFHVLQNNGTTPLNISAVADRNGRDFACGFGGSCTVSAANFSISARNNESDSCIVGLDTSFQLMADASNNLTVGLCDRLDFADDSDELLFFYILTIPDDVSPGLKEMTITYEGLSN